MSSNLHDSDFDQPGVETAIRWAGTRPLAVELLKQLPAKRPGLLDGLDPETQARWKVAKRLRRALKVLPELPTYHLLFEIGIDRAKLDQWQRAVGIYEAASRGDIPEVERILADVGDERLNQLWAQHVGDPDVDDPAREAAVKRATYFTKRWVKLMVDTPYNDVIETRARLGIARKQEATAGTLLGFVRSPIPPSIRFAVLARDNYTCRYCGRRAPDVALEIDHRKPVSLGGSNDVDNLVTSCFECNRGKSNRFET